MKLSSFMPVPFGAASYATVTRPSLRDRLLEAHSSLRPGSLPVQPKNITSDGIIHGTKVATAAAAATTISGNLAGASQGSPPSGTTYANVIGTWTIPTISKASENNVSYGLFLWVGIDGNSDSGGL
jgi:hypothetical protein